MELKILILLRCPAFMLKKLLPLWNFEDFEQFCNVNYENCKSASPQNTSCFVVENHDS